MSLTPDKKSDLKKSWMPSRQRKTKQAQPEYHLIVMDGSKTEPAYFQAVKAKIDEQYRNRISIDIPHKNTTAANIQLFYEAVRLAESSPNTYRHVWIVYDTDDFPAEYIDRVPKFCRQKKSQETQYHAVWSNQCFELWYLLHFSYMQSDLHRSEYNDKLTKCLNKLSKSKYNKTREDMYHILRPYLDTAITNAKRLADVNGNKQPSQAKPGTRVFELMEMLRPYL